MNGHDDAGLNMSVDGDCAVTSFNVPLLVRQLALILSLSLYFFDRECELAQNVVQLLRQFPIPSHVVVSDLISLLPWSWLCLHLLRWFMI